MAKLTKIVLYFDDGTEHEVLRGYTAVYENRGRALRAQEKEPFDPNPPGRPRDMGKDDANGFTPPDRCYTVNGAIVCP